MFNMQYIFAGLIALVLFGTFGALVYAAKKDGEDQETYDEYVSEETKQNKPAFKRKAVFTNLDKKNK